MRIDGILAERRPVFSFEFFPPKTADGLSNLRETLAVLSDDAPDFVSVTYGALGSTRDTTIDIVKWIKQDLGIEAMAHFTCVGATVDELRATLDEIEAAGVDNVLALRGDPPAGQDEWVQTDGGLLYSTELIELLSEHYGFAVGAAAFPEVDPAERDTWIPSFLDHYQAELGRHCAPFEGIEPMLAALEAAGCVWGIVTNKPEYLAAPLLPMLGWQDRCAVLIGGDTLAARKPDPLPLVVAAERIGFDPGECI